MPIKKLQSNLKSEKSTICESLNVFLKKIGEEPISKNPFYSRMMGIFYR